MNLASTDAAPRFGEPSRAVMSALAWLVATGVLVSGCRSEPPSVDRAAPSPAPSVGLVKISAEVETSVPVGNGSGTGCLQMSAADRARVLRHWQLPVPLLAEYVVSRGTNPLTGEEMIVRSRMPKEPPPHPSAVPQPDLSGVPFVDVDEFTQEAFVALGMQLVGWDEDDSQSECNRYLVGPELANDIFTLVPDEIVGELAALHPDEVTGLAQDVAEYVELEEFSPSMAERVLHRLTRFMGQARETERAVYLWRTR